MKTSGTSEVGLQRVGSDPTTERELYLLDLATPHDLPHEIVLPTPHFSCFLAWDSEQASVEDVARVAETLISCGGATFSCWGPGCERVHDIIDEIDADPFRDKPEDAVIMTTWHEDESLEDALWFFLNHSAPDTFYEDTLGTSLAISIGSGAWHEVVRGALAAPREFSERVVE